MTEEKTAKRGQPNDQLSAFFQDVILSVSPTILFRMFCFHLF